MHISEICTRSVVTCDRQTSALEVARRMRDRHVGDVVVVDMQGARPVPVGIITDRDLVVQVMALEVDPRILRAGDLMTEGVVTAAASEAVYDAIWHMRSKGVRRLPLVDAHNVLVGVLSADDVTRFLAEELGALARVGPQEIHREEAARPPLRR